MCLYYKDKRKYILNNKYIDSLKIAVVSPTPTILLSPHSQQVTILLSPNSQQVTILSLSASGNSTLS